MTGASPLGAILRAADPDRYLAALYAPAAKREALFALYAFNAEIAAVRDKIRQPLAGEMRLTWWRDVIRQGTPDAASGHPVASRLVQAIAEHGLPPAAFDNYLEARVFDLYDDPMPSRPDLEGYCGETASVVIQLAAMILDGEAASGATMSAGHAGCAQAITGLIRLLPIHRARGQCFVPADLLAAAGTSPEEFLAGEGGPSAGRAVAAMSALAREHLAKFNASAAALPQSLRPAFLPLSLTSAYLDRIERSDPLRASAELPPWRRQWLLFRRAARGWQ